MPQTVSNAELEAYLDELLSVDRMRAIEDLLRTRAELQQRLVAINGRRDAGIHSLGEIWRRHRLSCPSREQLGSYLLGIMEREAGEYIRFHLETVECRYCLASVEDLHTQQSSQADEKRSTRCARYFQSSAGYLHKHD